MDKYSNIDEKLNNLQIKLELFNQLLLKPENRTIIAGLSNLPSKSKDKESK